LDDTTAGSFIARANPLGVLQALDRSCPTPLAMLIQTMNPSPDFADSSLAWCREPVEWARIRFFVVNRQSAACAK